MTKLADFKALTFGCYGTLIDWETGMVEGLKPLTSRVCSGLSRDQIIEAHGRHEASQQSWAPRMLYRELLAIVYKRLAEEWSVPVTQEECVRYGQSVRDWPAFPDTADALAYLKKHYKLVVLSNVDNASFEGTNEHLQVEFDAIYTAEDVGSYKPSDRNFDYMLQKLKTIGIEREDILHTADSMFHDHAPANRHGLASCWIHRSHDGAGGRATMNPGDMPQYDFRFNSLADLVKAHRAATAQ